MNVSVHCLAPAKMSQAHYMNLRRSRSRSITPSLSDSDRSTSSSLEILNDSSNEFDERLTPLNLTSPPMEPETCLHWVRMSSLRVHDNAAFAAAMEAQGLRFKSALIYDPWFESGQRFGLNRWRFLKECMEDLDKTLQRYGARLNVVKGQPLAILERLCSSWNVKQITYQIDKDADSYILEQSVDSLAEKLGISVLKFEGHTLYDSEKILKSHSSVYTLKDFKAVISSCGPPEKPIDPPSPKPVTPEITVPVEYRIPSLQDVGFSAQESIRCTDLWVGGETVALAKVTNYVMTRSKMTRLNVDALLDKSSLSPYIRFGCLSVRYLFWKIKELASEDPSLEEFHKIFVSGILNREFYFTVASQVPNFDSYESKVCVQLPWEDNNELLKLWRYGKTGFPWIDAAMRQLWQEGWIHYVLRESVAFFLTRGELWISWEHGRRIFWELLLDYENSVSSGCWLKSSSSAFINGPVEHYCPVTYGISIDPTGEYIRRYIPELKNFPSEYIYQPWTAPQSVQIAASCRIGVDYPLPVINHITTGALCHYRLKTIMTLLHKLNTGAVLPHKSSPVHNQPPYSPTVTTQ